MLAATVCSNSLVLTTDASAKTSTCDDSDLKAIPPLQHDPSAASATKRSCRAAVPRGMFGGSRAHGRCVPSHYERRDIVPTRTGSHDESPYRHQKNNLDNAFLPVESFFRWSIFRAFKYAKMAQWPGLKRVVDIIGVACVWRAATFIPVFPPSLSRVLPTACLAQAESRRKHARQLARPLRGRRLIN